MGSKDMGLAGERIGYVAANPESEEAATLTDTIAMNNALLGNCSPPSMIQFVMADLLAAGPLQTLAGQYKESVDALYAILRDAGFASLEMPDAGFDLFPKLPIN